MTTASRLLALTAASGLALSLVACASGEPEPTTVPTDPAASNEWCEVPSGDASESITASGEFGEAAELEFDPGVTATETERTVLTEGAGQVVAEGSTIQIAYAIYGGASGEVFETLGYDNTKPPVPLTAATGAVLPGLLKTVGCVPVGSRVVSVIVPADAFGEEGFEGDGFSVAGDESLVVVMDVIRSLDRAWGVDREVDAELPAVVLADDGAPTLTIPDAAAPTELQLGVLKEGDGPVVPEGASVMVQYHGVSWDTGEVFDSSWERPTAAQFSLAQVVEGFAAAIAGQTVGSQVVVVMPPELAYGSDPDAHQLGGQTLVFVIDILTFGTAGL